MTSRTIALAELAEQHGDHNDFLVLVRTPAEFETAHIKGSYNVPLATLTEHREEVSGHVDRDVVQGTPRWDLDPRELIPALARR